MQDFEVKNAKIFWGGLSPPQTPPNNEEGTPPPQTPPLNVGKVPTFCYSSPPPPEIPGSVTDHPSLYASKYALLSSTLIHMQV